MKRISYRALIGAVMAALKTSITDTDIAMEQCLFWVKEAVNRINGKRLMVKRTGSLLVTFTDVPVKIQTDGAGNILEYRKYLELPGTIFDLERDNAIHWIAYKRKLKIPTPTNKWCEPKYFQWSTLPQINRMMASPFEKPSPDECYKVRVNKLVYLFGIENLPEIVVDCALYTSLGADSTATMLDDEVLLNDEDILEVVSSVMSIGRWVLLVPNERIVNATDERQIPAYKQLNPQIDTSQYPQQQQQMPVDQI